MQAVDVRVSIDRDTGKTVFMAGPDNANRNFAPVRDEHFVWGTVATALIIYTPQNSKRVNGPKANLAVGRELARNIKMVVGDSTNHRVTTG